MVEVKYNFYTLNLNHEFRLANYTRNTTPGLLIALEYENITGFGEASFPQYLEETPETAMEFIKKVDNKNLNPLNLQESTAYITSLVKGNSAVKAAFDIALHDLYARLMGLSLYKIIGVQKAEGKETSYTIGITEESLLGERIKEAENFEFLKIKLGSEDDKKMITELRKHTNKKIYADVNQGWTDRVYALEMIYWLAENGVVLVEQPLKVGRFEDSFWLTEHSPIPIIADESVKNTSDLLRLKGVFAGINVKLMKTGGLAEARRLIDTAKAYGMKIMLGCMTETSCAISAAANFMSLADWVDLDGNLLISNDPFEGVKTEKGKIFMNDLPGNGVRLKGEYEKLFQI